MSSGAKVLTHIAKETVPGTTPVSPNWQVLRFNSNTLTPTPTLDESEEITDSRVGQGSDITEISITGEISGNLSFGTFDELLEAAFYGEWDDDVLTVGEKRTTFSISKSFRDAGVYHLFKGAHVSSMTLDVPETGGVTLGFEMSCMDYDDAQSAFATSASPATTTPRMTSLAVGTVKIDGQSMDGQACVSAITMNLNNHLRERPCLGNEAMGPAALIETEAEITGTLTLAWSVKSWEIWKNQLTRKTLSVEFPITDSLGNKYVFNFPAIEVDGELPSGGKRDLLSIALNYTVAKQAPVIERHANGEID